jgi:small subunit ribosomal protein S20
MEETSLANHKSAIKRHKQSVKARERNRMVKTRVKNAIKAVRLAVTGKDPEAAEKALLSASSVLDRAATKKVIHWKKAARNISRLTLAVNALKTA